MRILRSFNSASRAAFTLIEIAISLAIIGFALVAIIGVLAAIAIPAYQDYTVRSQVTMALVQLENARAAAEPYVIEHEAYPDDFSQINVPASELESRYGVISLVPEGIELTIRSDVAAANDQTIIYGAYRMNDGSIGWSCAGGTLARKYRPLKCR